MKKHRLFSASLLLLLSQFSFAQSVKIHNAGVEKAPTHYPQILIVNGKPARLANESNYSNFATMKFQRAAEISDKGWPVPRSVIFTRSVVSGSTIISSPFGNGSISTSLSLTSTCIGSSFVIDYSSVNAIFNTGNVFSAQLSDALGSFTSPVEIGSIVSTAVMGSISVTIPSDAVPGADYKIRVVSNDPVITGSSSSTFSINSVNTWTGAVSSAWEDPANWGCGTVPNANTDVVINSGTVVVSSNAICRSLDISNTVTLTINTGFALTVVH